jgi:hypothetical protein
VPNGHLDSSKAIPLNDQPLHFATTARTYLAIGPKYQAQGVGNFSIARTFLLFNCPQRKAVAFFISFYMVLKTSYLVPNISFLGKDGSAPTTGAIFALANDFHGPDF